MKHTYAIPVVFFVEVEYEVDFPKNPLVEQENIKKVLVEEMSWVVGNLDSVLDGISERVLGIVNSIQVQK
jgi:hypothetical protein